MDIPYQEINSKTIDRWVEEGWEWGKPVSHEEYEKAKAGTWDVKLTPVKFVPHSWLGELKGKRVLGLASGGGQQMPIFAALGAQCTVLDYSQRQLDSEKMVAEREGYDITIVRADMTKRLPFDENSFDLIFHPVSNCYVYAVLPIWRECARVLNPGGRLLAGLDNGLNFAFDEDETRIINTLPFNPLEDEEQMRQLDARNIKYESCPGVSACFGAAASLNLEYTQPEVSQSLIITRMEGRTPVPEKEQLASLAAHGATMVIFLSIGLIDKVQQALLAGGAYTPETPAAVVYKASWPEQKVVRCTVGTLAGSTRANGITKTALIVVGEFLGTRYERSKLYDPTFTTEFRKGADQ